MPEHNYEQAARDYCVFLSNFCMLEIRVSFGLFSWQGVTSARADELELFCSSSIISSLNERTKFYVYCAL